MSLVVYVLLKMIIHYNIPEIFLCRQENEQDLMAKTMRFSPGESIDEVAAVAKAKFVFSSLSTVNRCIIRSVEIELTLERV